jgi:ribosomal protein L1
MSSSGQIFISSVVILANARSVDPTKGTQNVVFDVNFPVKDGKKRTLGLFRYFTPENRVGELQKVWENNFTKAFIIAKVSFSHNYNFPNKTFIILHRSQLCLNQEYQVN